MSAGPKQTHLRPYCVLSTVQMLTIKVMKRLLVSLSAPLWKRHVSITLYSEESATWRLSSWEAGVHLDTKSFSFWGVIQSLWSSIFLFTTEIASTYYFVSLHGYLKPKSRNLKGFRLTMNGLSRTETHSHPHTNCLKTVVHLWYSFYRANFD